jgi:hypothetical protein
MKKSLTSFLKRYPDLWDDKDQLFDPEYTQIERIIGKDQDGDEVEYLIKWKNLSYDECTWEHFSVLKQHIPDIENHIKYYQVRNKLFIGAKKQPKFTFKRLDESPTYGYRTIL